MVLGEIVNVEHVPTLVTGVNVLLPSGQLDNTMMRHLGIKDCDERVH